MEPVFEVSRESGSYRVRQTFRAFSAWQSPTEAVIRQASLIQFEVPEAIKVVVLLEWRAVKQEFDAVPPSHAGDELHESNTRDADFDLFRDGVEFRPYEVCAAEETVGMLVGVLVTADSPIIVDSYIELGESRESRQDAGPEFALVILRVR